MACLCWLWGNLLCLRVITRQLIHTMHHDYENGRAFGGRGRWGNGGTGASNRRKVANVAQMVTTLLMVQTLLWWREPSQKENKEKSVYKRITASGGTAVFIACNICPYMMLFSAEPCLTVRWGVRDLLGFTCPQPYPNVTEMIERGAPWVTLPTACKAQHKSRILLTCNSDLT